MLGPSGNIPTLQIGGRIFTDLTNLITLTASMSGAKWSTARKLGVAAGYQVTAGKTLKIYAAVVSNEGTGTFGVQLSQSDNDTGHNGVTAQTNAVPLIPTTVTGAFSFNCVPTGGQIGTFSFDAPVASQKFLTVLGIGASNGDCIFYGYEA